MTIHRTADYLDHMLEAAQQAHIYLEGLDKADFLEDKRTQQAVILNLVILGEAVTKLINQDEPFVDHYPDVPWRSMKGMRNRLAHGYFDINLDVVWDTVQTALPRLLAQLPAIRDAARAADNDSLDSGG
jgi:uncharacterized protein with HEPN domain